MLDEWASLRSADCQNAGVNRQARSGVIIGAVANSFAIDEFAEQQSHTLQARHDVGVSSWRGGENEME
jgi:hypothetical protein